MESQQGKNMDYSVRVKLSVLGSARDYTEIDALLGVGARHFARRGIGLFGRPPARQNVWSYWPEASDRDVAGQLATIVDLIVRTRSRLVALAEDARLEVAIVVEAYSAFPRIEIRSSQLRAVASIEAELNPFYSAALRDMPDFLEHPRPDGVVDFAYAVGLRVSGAGPAVDDPTTKLGLQGERTRTRGDATGNVWTHEVEPTADPHDLDERWNALTRILAERKGPLADIARSARLDAFIRVNAYRDSPEFELSAKSLALLADVGAGLTIEVAGDLTGEVF